MSAADDADQRGFLPGQATDGALLSMAVRIGRARLIDNMLLE